MNIESWWLLSGLALALGAAVIAALALLRHRRIREQRRRIVNDLDDMGISEARVMLMREDGEPIDLDRAFILRDRSGRLSRKLAGFHVAIADGPGARRTRILGKRLRMRFNHRGVPHVLQVRATGRRRLSNRLKAQLGMQKGRIFRLRPHGEITKSDQREIMRFSFDRAEGGDVSLTGDAVRYVAMTCSLRLSNVPAPAGKELPDRLDAAAVGLTLSEPCPVKVIDFSVTGLQVEGDGELALILSIAADAPDMERALRRPELVLLTIDARLNLPPNLDDVHAKIPPNFPLLGRIVRTSLRDSERQGTFRLAIEFLYEPVETGPGLPSNWRLLGHGIDSDALSEIHRVLNLASTAARIVNR